MLKLTKRADYGLIALKHLTVIHPDGSASAKEIAECYHIPTPLLSKILQELARKGFLTALQGVRGGYRLARDPDRINALEVIRAIDGPVILTSCFTQHGACDQSERCTVREPLRKVHEGILSLLSGISMKDMLGDGDQCGKAGGNPGKLYGLS